MDSKETFIFIWTNVILMFVCIHLFDILGYIFCVISLKFKNKLVKYLEENPKELGFFFFFLAFLFILFYFFGFLGPHPWHMEIPRLGVQFIRATAASLYNNHSNVGSKPCLQTTPHSSQQCQILNLLSEARDQTHILMDTSWVH